MRIALWIASPPTCSVRSPRASLTAMGDFDFLSDKGYHAERGEEGKRGGGEDRQVIRAERIERRAGEPRPEERADAGAGIEAADDAGDREAADEAAQADEAHQRHALRFRVASVLGIGAEMHHGNEEPDAAQDQR